MNTEQHLANIKKHRKKAKELFLSGVIVSLCDCDEPNSYPKKELGKFYCTKCGKDI